MQTSYISFSWFTMERLCAKTFHSCTAIRECSRNTKVDDKPIWRAEPYEHEAWETYWYRKFYTEVLTGQLMVIRPDEPILYRYDRAMHDVTRDIGFVTLIKGYRLLWIAVALIAAIAFPLLKPYLAIIATALFLDLLYRCWATRKIGR